MRSRPRAARSATRWRGVHLLVLDGDASAPRAPRRLGDLLDHAPAPAGLRVPHAAARRRAASRPRPCRRARGRRRRSASGVWSYHSASASLTRPGTSIAGDGPAHASASSVAELARAGARRRRATASRRGTSSAAQAVALGLARARSGGRSAASGARGAPTRRPRGRPASSERSSGYIVFGLTATSPPVAARDALHELVAVGRPAGRGSAARAAAAGRAGAGRATNGSCDPLPERPRAGGLPRRRRSGAASATACSVALRLVRVMGRVVFGARRARRDS